MHQFTLRLPDELADELRSAAAARGRSVNAWVVEVLTAAVDPDFAGDEAERLRARLHQAGLLASGGPTKARRPVRDRLARAQKAAGRGRALSDIVSEERR